MSRRGILLATVAGAVVVAAAFVGREDRPAPRRSPGTATAATPATVAVRPSDLPSGLKHCPYSGDMEAYLSSVRARQPEFYEGAASIWHDMQARGAVAGYAAFYARDGEACDNLIRPQERRAFGDEEEHIRNHPRMVFSLVYQFADEASAAAAYRADTFGQSRLKTHKALQLAEGEPTNLGPNSIVGDTRGSPIQFRNAFWQRKGFVVAFSSTALERHESETITAAIDIRIR